MAWSISVWSTKVWSARTYRRKIRQLLMCQSSQLRWAVGAVTDSRSIADLAGTLIEPLPLQPPPRSGERPVTHWCWTCPPRRPGPWTPTRSPATGAPHHRSTLENRCSQADSGARCRSRRRDAAVEVCHGSAHLAGSARGRENPALDTGTGAAHPDRSRTDRPRRLQCGQPARGRRVSRHEESRQLRGVGILDPASHVRLPVESGMGSRATQSHVYRAAGHRQERHPDRTRPRRSHRPATKPLPHRHGPARHFYGAWSTTPSAKSSTACYARTS